MRIDDAGHAALLCRSESTWATTAALEPPSAMSSTKRRIAINASVWGTKPTAAATAENVGADRRLWLDEGTF
jgi:hypothetical protein